MLVFGATAAVNHKMAWRPYDLNHDDIGCDVTSVRDFHATFLSKMPIACASHERQYPKKLTVPPTHAEIMQQIT